MVTWQNAKKPLAWAAGVLGVLTLLGGGVAYWVWNDVPSFDALRRSVKVETQDASGKPGFRWIGPQAPGWVPLKDVSNYAVMALVASEDTAFFQHEGVDFHEVREAIKKDLKERRFARGASTITQQVVKNVFLSSEKTLWRKIREVLWAAQMEGELTKREILAFYVNMVELGPGIYGIKQAAAYYFDKSPSELEPREGAFLAMLLPSPRRYHQNFADKELTAWATKRVNRILEVMHRMGFIGELEYRMGLERQLWPTADPTAVGADGISPTDESTAAFPTVLPEAGQGAEEGEGEALSDPIPPGEDSPLEEGEGTEVPGQEPDASASSEAQGEGEPPVPTNTPTPSALPGDF